MYKGVTITFWFIMAALWNKAIIFLSCGFFCLWNEEVAEAVREKNMKYRKWKRKLEGGTDGV